MGWHEATHRSLRAPTGPTTSPPYPGVGVCAQGKPWHGAAKPGVWLLSLPTQCCSDACAWSCPIPTLALHGITSDLPIAVVLFGHPWAVADHVHHPCTLSVLLAGCGGMMLCWEGPSPLAPGLTALAPQLLPYTYLKFPKHIRKCVWCKITIHIK